nr:nuclear transport factor 2 family protein [Sulfitobacter algicola]
MIKGYSADEKKRLGEVLTDAVRLVVPAEPDAITVMMHELDPTNYYRGRTTRSPAPAVLDPAKIVRDYLSLMETRDLDAAQSMLAEGFMMTFPGTLPMTSLKDLIDWAAQRYQFVTKAYEGFDVLQGSGDAAIVYCRGTLSGAWPDGKRFENIRFIDRFEVVAGKITKQDVWNDIAEKRSSHE